MASCGGRHLYFRRKLAGSPPEAGHGQDCGVRHGLERQVRTPYLEVPSGLTALLRLRSSSITAPPPSQRPCLTKKFRRKNSDEKIPMKNSDEKILRPCRPQFYVHVDLNFTSMSTSILRPFRLQFYVHVDLNYTSMSTSILRPIRPQFYVQIDLNFSVV